ncbi:MAG: RNA-binding S4 domain-containing protein [Burkholderiaceae bacterium]
MKPREALIRVEPVELVKLLKFESLVSSGGEAKIVITEGLVSVNGEVETRKRRKLVAGDVIEYAGEKLLLRLA